jgi:hypothetical protein
MSYKAQIVRLTNSTPKPGILVFPLGIEFKIRCRIQAKNG